MRIISGKYKNRHIAVPSGFKARPTTDFARENLFNILSNTWDFDGLSVLDLFAGTGSIGLEFASRGAERCDLVEIDAKSARFIRKTVDQLGEGKINIYRTDSFIFLERCRFQYDIVFADPPYDLPELSEVPDRVISAGVLDTEGLLVLEHGKTNSFTQHVNFREVRKYGSVHFSFFMY